MKDQAEQLRKQLLQLQQQSKELEPRKTKVITVCSGKGGVGKSNFSLNFALALLRQQKKVLIFDVDLGLANIDVLLGIPPRRNMLHMIEQDLPITDIIEEGPEGLKFIAGGSGFNHLIHLEQQKIDRLFEELSHLHGQVDYIILDTGAGLSNESLRFILAADDVIVVTTPEPTAITDAYAVLKMVYTQQQKPNIRLVINRCSSHKEGRETGQKLKLVTRRFLNQEIGVLGYIPDDPNVMKAVKKQKPFLIQFPSTDASVALSNLARAYLDLPIENQGGIKSFLTKFLKSRSKIGG
ncbi:MinD/ParA family protein [Bacillus horti]|uniref:Flagellar biosynthesis protein FlhG n=1 Tax=Caldalkalibacillus horti TaxID=77523 RepID=A0ABT9VUL5_9BACI|nr:MinD/ParA family protein [Bacillus horti]MDQ0164682.1 flagellar biosynthesis protein FlhG [Bacillus horti]